MTKAKLLAREETLKAYPNLRGADLHGADLHGTDLHYADLPETFKITRIDFGGWSVCITPKETSIGCQRHSNEK